MEKEIFLSAFEYMKILGPTIFVLSVVALTDEIILLLKRSVMAADPEDIYGYGETYHRRRRR